MPAAMVPQVSGDSNPADMWAMPNSSPTMPSPSSTCPRASQGPVGRSALSSGGRRKATSSRQMTEMMGTRRYAMRQSMPASIEPTNENSTAPTPPTAMKIPSAPGRPPLPVAKCFTYAKAAPKMAPQPMPARIRPSRKIVVSDDASTSRSPTAVRSSAAASTFLRPSRSASMPVVMTVAASARVLTAAASAARVPMSSAFAARSSAVELMLGSDVWIAWSTPMKMSPTMGAICRALGAPCLWRMLMLRGPWGELRGSSHQRRTACASGAFRARNVRSLYIPLPRHSPQRPA